MEEKNNKYIKLVIKIAVSAILLTIIFVRIDKNSVVESLKLIDLRYAPLIFLLIVMHYFVGALRWKSLLVHKNAGKVSLGYLINLYFVGAFFNNFMPTTIGGDVYKIFRLGKKIDSTVDAFSATFMERFTGVLALILISVVSLVKLLGLWGVILLVGFFLSVLVGFVALSFLATKHERLRKIYDSINLYREHKKIVFWAFLTSFLIQFLTLLTQYFVFKALGVSLPLAYTFFILPLINLASFFIPSLNGVGVQDALYMRFFLSVGVAEALSLSASIIYHLFRLGVSLIGGVLYAVVKED